MLPSMLSLQDLPRSRHTYHSPPNPTTEHINHMTLTYTHPSTNSKSLYPFHAGSLQMPQTHHPRTTLSRKHPLMAVSRTKHTLHISAGTAQQKPSICPHSPRMASGFTAKLNGPASKRTWPTCSTASPRLSLAQLTSYIAKSTYFTMTHSSTPSTQPAIMKSQK